MHPRRGGGAGELSALEQRAVLAHRVQLVDGGACREEETGERLLLAQRDGWGRRRHQRGAAARDEEEHEVVPGDPFGQGADASRRHHTPLVRHGVTGLDHLDLPGRGQMPVLDDDQALRDPLAQAVLDGRRHRCRRLPRPEHHQAPARGRLDSVERRGGQRARVGGAEGGIEDRAGDHPQAHRASFCSRRPASISMSSVFGKQKRILVRPSAWWA